MQQPLKHSDLQTIQNANLKRQEVLVLLREIKRLRGLVVEVTALLLRWGEMDQETQRALEFLQERLDQEPCVVEHAYHRSLAARSQMTDKRNSQPRGPAYAMPRHVK